MRFSYCTLASVSAFALIASGSGTAVAQTTGQTQPADQNDSSADQSAGSQTGPDTNSAPSTEKKQSQDTQEEVVVTGIRQSLATAEAIKKNSDQIVDSITAEDIGKFPDTNIAESLQRISGIQIQRNLGEGSTVQIRGLSDNRTELNGHDIFTANGGVGLSFEEVGPDLLSRVDVYKNPTAKMIEGSLGGTIDLRTRMPFDASGRVISATGSLTRYDLAKKTGKNISGLFSDRWTTGIGEIGLLLNASYQTGAFRQDLDQVEPYYWHGPDNPAPDGASTRTGLVPGYENQDIQVPKGGGFNVAGGTRKRVSYSGVFQWRPTSNVEFYAQILTAKYHFTDSGVSFFATDENAPPVGTFTVKDGVATSGALANPAGISITYGANRHTKTTDISTGLKWSLTDHLHVTTDYQHIDAWVHQDSMNLFLAPYTRDGSGAGVPGLFNEDYNYTFDNTGNFPVQGSSNPDFFSNPANYGFYAFQPTRTRNSAKGDSVRGDLEWDFDDNIVKNLTGGVRYSKKSAINRTTDQGNWQTVGGTCASWSSAANCHLVSEHPDFVELNPGQATLLRGAGSDSVFGPVLEWKQSATLNPEEAFAEIKAITGQTVTFGDLNNPAQSTTSSVDEKDTAAYAQASFGSTLGSMDWDGNVGVRYVHTDEFGHGFESLTYRTGVASDGSAVSTSTVNPFDGARKYSTWLPSVNLRLHITPKLQARLAFSKNIYRPTFSQLNPSFRLSPRYTDTNGTTATTPTTVNPSLPYDPVTNPYQGDGSISGNANLKPERVTSFDGTLEWYFQRDGYVYIDAFRKNLRDVIQTSSFQTTQTLPNVGVVRFDVNAVINNDQKSYVQGFEVGGQKFFDFLPGALSGLGVAANYTLADSNAGNALIGPGGSARTIRVPLINLSKYSYNLMLLYDKYGFNARLAYNWRSKFLDSVSEVGAENLPIWWKSYGVLDASISYDINQNVSITLDGQNLTDHVEKSYQGEPIYLRNYQINDRRYSVRLRVRF